MPNKKNIDTVKDISQKIEKSASLTFFEYKNLGSNVLNELRRRAKEASAEVLVAKNTLVKLALGSKKVQDSDLKGQTGVLFSFDDNDSVGPLKILFDFSKKFEKLKIKGAFIDGAYYDSAKVQQISALPSRVELITKVLSGFMHPVCGFVNVLGGTRSKFVYAMSAIAKKREVGE